MRRSVRVAFWLFVATLFAGPAAYHLEMRTWKLPQLDVQARAEDTQRFPGGGSGLSWDSQGRMHIIGGGVDDTTIAVEKQMNEQLGRLNDSHQDDFTWAFYADVAAIFAALLSAAMEAFPTAEKRHTETGTYPDEGDGNNGQSEPIHETEEATQAEEASSSANPKDSRVDMVAPLVQNTPHPPTSSDT